MPAAGVAHQDEHVLGPLSPDLGHLHGAFLLLPEPDVVVVPDALRRGAGRESLPLPRQQLLAMMGQHGLHHHLPYRLSRRHHRRRHGFPHRRLCRVVVVRKKGRTTFGELRRHRHRELRLPDTWTEAGKHQMEGAIYRMAYVWINGWELEVEERGVEREKGWLSWLCEGQQQLFLERD